MSGILHEFAATSVRYSNSERKVYMIGKHIGSNSTFVFDLMCTHRIPGSHAYVEMWMFFDLTRSHCLVVHRSPYGDEDGERYGCSLLRFWIEDDLPVLSVKLFEKQDKIIEKIANEFKEKYAARLLDDIINS